MDIPLRRLPSLDALKGFDAAARHLSFTRAAAELSLTQSAISRQVQTLEEQLGVRLFARGVRRLIDEGRLAPLMEARERVASRGYFLLRAVGERRPEVEAFAAWLLEEAKGTR